MELVELVVADSLEAAVEEQIGADIRAWRSADLHPYFSFFRFFLLLLYAFTTFIYPGIP